MTRSIASLVCLLCIACFHINSYGPVTRLDGCWEFTSTVDSTVVDGEPPTIENGHRVDTLLLQLDRYTDSYSRLRHREVFDVRPHHSQLMRYWWATDDSIFVHESGPFDTRQFALRRGDNTMPGLMIHTYDIPGTTYSTVVAQRFWCADRAAT
jgi:hypothetical protein